MPGHTGIGSRAGSKPRKVRQVRQIEEPRLFRAEEHPTARGVAHHQPVGQMFQQPLGLPTTRPRRVADRQGTFGQGLQLFVDEVELVVHHLPQGEGGKEQGRENARGGDEQGDLPAGLHGSSLMM